MIIVYVLGHGRTGSTAIGASLLNIKNSLAMGEIINAHKAWPRLRKKISKSCACQKNFSYCPWEHIARSSKHVAIESKDFYANIVNHAKSKGYQAIIDTSKNVNIAKMLSKIQKQNDFELVIVKMPYDKTNYIKKVNSIPSSIGAWPKRYIAEAIFKNFTRNILLGRSLSQIVRHPKVVLQNIKERTSTKYEEEEKQQEEWISQAIKDKIRVFRLDPKNKSKSIKDTCDKINKMLNSSTKLLPEDNRSLRFHDINGNPNRISIRKQLEANTFFVY